MSNNAKSFAPEVIAKNLLTIGALAFLFVLPFQIKDKDYKSGLAKAGIFSLVVLLSSNLSERLSKLRFEKSGIEFELNNVQNNVKANRSATQRESQALGLLGLILLNKSNKAREYFFDILLQDGEVKTLESLFEAEKNNTELLYEKSEDFEEQLRHLRALNFIEPKLLTTTDINISSLPKSDNLRRYFKISKMGILCLALGSNSKQVRPDEIAPECKELLKEITKYDVDTPKNYNGENLIYREYIKQTKQ